MLCQLRRTRRCTWLRHSKGCRHSTASRLGGCNAPSDLVVWSMRVNHATGTHVPHPPPPGPALHASLRHPPPPPPPTPTHPPTQCPGPPAAPPPPPCQTPQVGSFFPNHPPTHPPVQGVGQVKHQVVPHRRLPAVPQQRHDSSKPGRLLHLPPPPRNVFHLQVGGAGGIGAHHLEPRPTPLVRLQGRGAKQCSGVEF
jgi:hypothetical protein